MKIKSFYTYTPKQMKEIVDFISEHYEGGGYVAHETESEYVHTDMYISEDDEMKDFITFGMGAAKMKAPIEELERIELVMHSSLDTELTSQEGRELLCGLVDLSKYPFRNNTWFGVGHTVDVSKRFAETFGYEFVLLVPTSLVFSPSDTTNGVKNVMFLDVVPIYADERDWIVENDSFVYLDLLYYKFGNEAFFIDKKREHFIPSEKDILLLEDHEVN